jgi:hypothetical protein
MSSPFGTAEARIRWRAEGSAGVVPKMAADDGCMTVAAVRVIPASALAGTDAFP